VPDHDEGRAHTDGVAHAGDLAAVVLAAGRGTRFRSERPKVLHAAAGRSLIAHVLTALAPARCARVLVVVGHGAPAVEEEVRAVGEALGIVVETVVQPEQRGTGDAVEVALGALATGAAVERLLVVPGDTPLVTPATFSALVAASAGVEVALLTTRPEDPTGYGRIVRSADGPVARIVEHRDATDEERAIGEVNAGMYVVGREAIAAALADIGADNDQGERYLTDAVVRLIGAGASARAVEVSADEVAGVNDRKQLADAAGVLRRRHLDHLMREVGVSVIDPATTHVDVDVAVGVDATILPGTVLDRGTVIGAGATVGPNAHLSACTVGEGAVVHSSRGEGAEVGPGVQVGPFAHLRPGTRLLAGSRVGAFVQIKNTTVGEGAKVPHLAYLGDATVGRGANVACGVVTVNFDGHDKHPTAIGDGAFVGCGVMLIAPVTVGDGAFVAAGSTITHDVPPDALAVARVRQQDKPGWAARRRAARGR
jgi:bifunctional UDP-N-acetylglucosamine pyrophosphorylase / glucosamine-1-phosphate N-acetyltransferase